MLISECSENTCDTHTHTKITHVSITSRAVCFLQGIRAHTHHYTAVPLRGAPAPVATFPSAYAPHWGPRPSD